MTRVKVWRDNGGLGSGTFDSTDDILVGSGTFNTAGPLGAQVLFFSPETLVTQVAAPPSGKRYFVTYDIDPIAAPEQTLGARLDPGVGGSFPQNLNGVDNPADDMISEPNTMVSFSAFSSNLGTIVPAPQMVNVTPIPIYTNSRTGLIHHSPRLNTDFSASASSIAIWTNDIVVSTNDPTLYISTFPIYAVIDSEIVLISSRTTGGLTMISRGQLGSSAASHSSGTVIGFPVTGCTLWNGSTSCCGQSQTCLSISSGPAGSPSATVLSKNGR